MCTVRPPPREGSVEGEHCGPAGSGSPARLIPWVGVVPFLPPLLGQDHQGLGLGPCGGQFAATVGPSCATKLIFSKCANLA